MKLLIINGPNLNLLGIREPDIYGKQTLAALEEQVRSYCDARKIETAFYQSNHEGDIVDKIQAAYGVYDGLIINPAAYTHTSIAIPDAIKAVGIPTVEVHLSDINAREAYRRHSFTSEASLATIAGKHFAGYLEAVDLLEKHLSAPDV